MASSTTQIGNRALTKLGEQRVLSLGDDNNAGRTLNSMFDQVRDAELRRHNWKFALKRAMLPALVDAPAFGYAYQFPLPSDFLRLVQVGEVYIRPFTKYQSSWSVERASDDSGQVILCNIAAPLPIRYVSRVENSALFDPLFVECFACKLAFEACEAITQSNTKQDSCSSQYKFALQEAVRCDSIEIPPDDIPWGTWLESREGASVGLQGSSQFYGENGFTVR